MGLGVTAGPIYLYLCVFMCLCPMCITLRPICVVSAEQISQVIGEVECYLYLSLSSLSFSPLSFIPIVSRPLSDLIFQLFSSLIPPVLASPISLSNTRPVVPVSFPSIPSFLSSLSLSISPYFFLLCPFLLMSHSSTLFNSFYTSSIPPTFTPFYFSNFSEWEPSNLEAAHLPVDR